jgi:hypothetical protein
MVFVARAVLAEAGGVMSFHAGTEPSPSVGGKEQARISETVWQFHPLRTKHERAMYGRSVRLTLDEN